MELTNNDAALIGALGEYPGFTLLRDYLQAGLDDLWTQIEQAVDDISERRYVSAWRERRKVLAEIDTLTKEYLPYAEKTLEAHQLLVSPPSVSSADLRAALRRMQEQSLDPGTYDIINSGEEDSYGG